MDECIHGWMEGWMDGKKTKNKKQNKNKRERECVSIAVDCILLDDRINGWMTV